MRRDTVTPDLHEAVLRRDRVCFLHRLDANHVCRDRWGTAHRHDDAYRLTVDHVHLIAGGVKGKRAPSDLAHLVAMCWAGNVGAPSREVRQAERAYLRGLYPDMEAAS